MTDVTVEVGYENFHGDFIHLATIPMYSVRGYPGGPYIGMVPDARDTLLDLVRQHPDWNQAWIRVKGIAVLILNYKQDNWILG